MTGCGGPSGSASSTAPTARAHAGTYLADHPGRFHWDQGVQRLALGAFMRGDTPATIGEHTVMPEDVRPEQHASAATYALLVRSLCADTAWLAQHQATLTEWADILVALVDCYIARDSDDARRDVERVRSMLAALAHVDLDGRRVGFREAREHALRRLGTARTDRGEPLAMGVMVAPLAAMRAFPFRIAFVARPRRGRVSRGRSAERARHPRAASPATSRRATATATRSSRSVLGAREALYLSYVAVEPKSGQALGPSSVVLELADALAPYLARVVEPRGARRDQPARAAPPVGGRARAAAGDRARAVGGPRARRAARSPARPRLGDPRRGRPARAARAPAGAARRARDGRRAAAVAVGRRPGRSR